MQKFEHCKLVGKRIHYLGRDSLFEKKADQSWSEATAWDYLENDGWELVSVTVDNKGAASAYFKRPASTK